MRMLFRTEKLPIVRKTTSSAENLSRSLLISTIVGPIRLTAGMKNAPITKDKQSFLKASLIREFIFLLT